MTKIRNWKYTLDQLREAVEVADSIHDVAKILGVRGGGSKDILLRRIIDENINFDHWTGKQWATQRRNSDGINKFCERCSELKLVNEFDKNSLRRDGLQTYCRLCMKILRRETQRKSDILRKYGITIERYQEMYDAQGGNCSICLRPMKRTNVDHNHLTGQVRDLLCNTCNGGLGNFKENPEYLMNAIKYLDKWEKIADEIL